MDSRESVLTSFTYANNKPYVVSKKAIETSSKVLKDLDDTGDDPPIENLPKDKEEVGQENEEDDIEWSGDEAELSREISILEQSISSKREHSPTKSPRKKKPY
jgi:hypothetical protein